MKRNPLVCRGVMILGGCVYEDGDTFEVRAECDDLAGCGYDEHLTEFDNDTTWTLTSDEFIDLHNRHLAHSRGEQLEERKWEI